MRFQFIALSIIVSLLLIGCQQNSPIEPNDNATSPATLNKNVAPASDRTLEFKDIISLPKDPNKVYEIRGTVRYSVKVLASLRSRLAEVNLSIEAVLTPANEKYPTAKFTQKSIDIVNLDDKGGPDLEKRYVVEESNTKFIVKMAFDVTSTTISIVQIAVDNGGTASDLG